MFCKYCGTQLDDGSAFCTKCGRAQAETKTTPPETPAHNNSSTYKLVCLILAIFFSVVFILIKVATRTSSNNTAIPISEEYRANREELEWYTLNQMQIKTADPIPASTSISIALGFKKGDKQAYSEIIARRVEIIDYLHRYFSSKTAEQLKPEHEDELKIEICDGINNYILSNSKISSVMFTAKDVVSQ